MRITDVEAIVVASPHLNPEAADATQDALLVRVTTDEGMVGYGEANHCPAAVRAFIETRGSNSWSRGLRELLIGADPLDPPKLWHRLYRETIMSGRRGLGVAALAAIDVALWDVRGKAEKKPIYELLGGRSGHALTPYATIYAGPMSYEDAIAENARLVQQALALGFRGVKLEALTDCVPLHDQVVEFVHRLARGVAGAEVMLDVGYRFENSAEALRYLAPLEDSGLYFVEAPVWLDDVAGYADVANASRFRVAVGELFVTRNEFMEMLDVGRVGVIQPSVIRVGITESVQVAALATARSRLVVPFGWVATTIGVMANIHLAATLKNCPFLEYCPLGLYPEQELRKHIAGPEPGLRNGEFVLPSSPGLGIEVDEDAVRHYRVE
jgi:L-rhamnonate dehydratase